MNDPLIHTKDTPVEGEKFFDRAMDLDCVVAIEFVTVKGQKLITDIEVNIAYTPSGWQEEIIAAIEERHPGCAFTTHPSFKLVKQKPLIV